MNAEKQKGRRIVNCPGGAYSAPMMSYEGSGVAKWLKARDMVKAKGN